MRLGILAAVLFCAQAALAVVVSPSSVEVKFAYTAEFQTKQTLKAEKLIEKQAEYLFGYMQSPELAVKFGINHRTVGWGAPQWPPAYQVVSDVKADGVRTIKYHAEGIWLLNRTAAQALLEKGYYDIMMPYDLDNYWQAKCVMEDEPDTPSSFSYFYDPYLKGCEKLVNSPLASDVRVELAASEPVDESLTADLESVRGDNGNGPLFEIMSVTGFADKGGRTDAGRTSFMELNAWLEGQGFEKTIVQHYKDRPVYQFDKDILVPGRGPVHIRMTRLLSSTDLDGDLVTFSKFFKEAIQQADVVMYAGHSGSSFVLEAKEIERHAGKLEFDYNKHQIFFFDACSGYSYYLPLFNGRKAPGTLGVMTFALTSQFGYEHAMHKAFLRHMLDFKEDHPKWMTIMTDMEKVLRGMTFMLNVQVQ